MQGCFLVELACRFGYQSINLIRNVVFMCTTEQVAAAGLGLVFVTLAQDLAGAGFQGLLAFC